MIFVMGVTMMKMDRGKHIPIGFPDTKLNSLTSQSQVAH